MNKFEKNSPSIIIMGPPEDISNLISQSKPFHKILQPEPIEMDNRGEVSQILSCVTFDWKNIF